MGPWRDEYERSWRAFATRAITDALGAQHTVHDVCDDDRAYLAALLQSMGVRDHAAPQPVAFVRKHTASRTTHYTSAATREPSCEDTQVIDDSLSGLAQDRDADGRARRVAANSSSLSEASYVYSTPQKLRHGNATRLMWVRCTARRSLSGQFFPQFSSQDFLPEDPATAARRESASQTLRLRMAGVSPIAPVRDHALRLPRQADGAIGDASSSTPQTGSPSVRASLDAALLHSGDEEFLTPRPVSSRMLEAHQQQEQPHVGSLTRDRLDALHHERSLHESHAVDLDVSMQSMNLSDDGFMIVDDPDDANKDDDPPLRFSGQERRRLVIEDEDEDVDDDPDPQEEHDSVPKVLYFSSGSDDDTDDDVADYDFGDVHESASNDEPDAEMDQAAEPEERPVCGAPDQPVAVKLESENDEVEIIAVVPPPAAVRPVATLRSANPAVNVANASRESCDSVDSVHDHEEASRPRPRPLFRTKLPLEIEYRHALDRRRRKQRRKSLLLKELGPYRMPEFRVDLAPYQQRAVAWMHAREQNTVHQLQSTAQEQRDSAQTRDRYARIAAKVQGGILADEMGLGKTVCCIALICDSLKHSRDACRQDAAASGSATPRIRPPTLIITPLSILSQWANEIRQKTNLSVITYHGTSRKTYRTAMEFMGADIVLSTYDTLRLKECKVSVETMQRALDSDDRSSSSNATAQSTEGEWRTVLRNTADDRRSFVASKLHQLVWHRIILDESHLITNASCARARAASTLQSKRRWCVTGTPIQNSSSDLTSLVNFVGIKHTTDAELNAVLPHIMLRRLKTTVDSASRTPILALPEKTEECIELAFANDLEAAFYSLLHRSTKKQILQYVQRTDAQPQYMHVFELLLRLRQTCNSFALVTADPVTEVRGHGTLLLAEASAAMTPGSKTTRLVERVAARFTGLSDAAAVPVPLQSTKLAALLTHLAAVKAKNERALVISQWTAFLDLIAESLERRNADTSSSSDVISFGKLDGRMSAKEREQIVAWFQQDKRLDVLLISLRTGGMGLNLTAASHVFIMEPSWNPSVESQAIDRAHRFGQSRPVRVVRFIMKSTIEERVIELQRKKRALATSLLGDAAAPSSTAAQETRLTRAELQQLFTQGGSDDW